ncbi:MAG: RIP metalloprotease RseP [Saprospiraceae bacterium]|nr:RIP metalloprotease RseP [Saprospiraceae bacterium]
MNYISILQLIASLSILVVLHELGHFLPAKWFKTKVEKFYLFFDVKFSLFKKKIGETEYGIGWLPLGGYVKIAGMIDESNDKEFLNHEPQPWEFRSKPAWQRLIIMLGGVTVNLILGLFLFAMIFWVYGEEYLPNKEVKYGIFADSIGRELGFMDGDKIISIGNKPFEKFNDRSFIMDVAINDANTFKVERNGEVKEISINPEIAKTLTKASNKYKTIFGPRFPIYVDTLPPDSQLKGKNVQKGDQLIGVNDSSTLYFNEIQSVLKNHKNDSILLSYIRNGKDTLKTMVLVDSIGKIGFGLKPLNEIFKLDTVNYSLGEAIPYGINYGFRTLNDQIRAIGQIFKGKIKANESLGSLISIGSTFGKVWVWERFWKMTALLSLVLAFMNLLPIPGLDGGHVVFLLYEVVSGRKPSDKVVEIGTTIGFFLLIGLMVYALGLDIMRLITGQL